MFEKKNALNIHLFLAGKIFFCLWLLGSSANGMMHFLQIFTNGTPALCTGQTDIRCPATMPRGFLLTDWSLSPFQVLVILYLILFPVSKFSHSVPLKYHNYWTEESKIKNQRHWHCKHCSESRSNLIKIIILFCCQNGKSWKPSQTSLGLNHKDDQALGLLSNEINVH